MYSNQTSVITKNIHNCHTNQPRSCTLLKMTNNDLMDTLQEDQQDLSTSSTASLSSILPTSINIPVNYILNTKNSLEKFLPDFYNATIFDMNSKCDSRSCSMYDCGKGKRRPIPVPVENKDDA